MYELIHQTVTVMTLSVAIVVSPISNYNAVYLSRNDRLKTVAVPARD